MALNAPKLIGDFGEGFVTYVLIRKGYEVAVVDHVGADLIAEKGGNRFAVSVKTRVFKKGSKESLVFVVEESHIEKLEKFAALFGMTAIFALLVCLSDEQMIHLMIVPVSKLKEKLPSVKHGYSIRFSPKTRNNLLVEYPFIDYSCWKEVKLGDKDFF